MDAVALGYLGAGIGAGLAAGLGGIGISCPVELFA